MILKNEKMKNEKMKMTRKRLRLRTVTRIMKKDDPSQVLFSREGIEICLI